MASEVDICNMALRVLNVKPIVALSPGVTQAVRDCALFYPQARNKTLEDFPWQFACRRKALTPFEIPEIWAEVYGYAYVYPSDALKLWGLYAPGGKYPVESKIVRAETGERIVLTDEENAEGEFTLADVQTSWFSAAFVDAVAALLRSYLAIPLTGDRNKKVEAYQEYGAALAWAKVSATQQDKAPKDKEDTWISDRTS